MNSYSKENFTTFYKEFQKINHSGIIEIKNKLSYKTLQSYSIQFGFGKISNQITKFASESNKEGITRAIAVIMQIPKIRSGIATTSKNNKLLNFLDLSENVFAEEKWSKIVTNSRNTVDFPDIRNRDCYRKEIRNFTDGKNEFAKIKWEADYFQYYYKEGILGAGDT